MILFYSYLFTVCLCVDTVFTSGVYVHRSAAVYINRCIMSNEQEPPVVDVCENQNPPLAPGEANKRFNFIQRHMRNSFGTLCFTIVALTIGTMPVVGIPPFLLLSAWLGVHWAIRRFFDMCTGNWMCVMCVSAP